MAQLQLEVGRGERRGVLAPGFSSLPRSTSSSGYPDPTTEDAAVSGSIPEFTARGPIGGIFRGLTPREIIPLRVSDMEDPVQPLTDTPTDHTMSGPTGGTPDNSTLCPRTYAQEPDTAYSRISSTRCRLVVTRDNHRTNTAAHLYVDGGAQLAVVTAKGVAGTVQLAVAGEHLEELIDSLIQAWVTR